MPEIISDDIFEEYFESSRQLARLLIKEIHEQLNKHSDLPHTAFIIMKILSKDGSKSQHDLALELCHTDASVSKLVSALVENGYVDVSPDPENRRRVLVDITPKGRQVLAKVEKSVSKGLRPLFEGAGKEQIINSTQFNKTIQENILNKQKDS